MNQPQPRARNIWRDLSSPPKPVAFPPTCAPSRTSFGKTLNPFEQGVVLAFRRQRCLHILFFTIKGYIMSSQTTAISLNTDYIKSRIGVLRILEAVIGICGIICGNEGAYCGYSGMHSFFNFVVTTTLILAIIILVIFFLGLDKHCLFINCPLSVFINDVVFAILYLVAAILMFITIGACSFRQVARIFAALFGVCGTIVVGLLALDGYQTFRGNQAAPKSEPA